MRVPASFVFPRCISPHYLLIHLGAGLHPSLGQAPPHNPRLNCLSHLSPEMSDWSSKHFSMLVAIPVAGCEGWRGTPQI